MKLDQLTEMYNKYEVEAHKRRAKLHADDPSIQLQLGKILARVGDHDGAIGAFQQARTSSLPNVKIDAPIIPGSALRQTGRSSLLIGIIARRSSCLSRKTRRCFCRCITSLDAVPSHWGTMRPRRSITTRLPRSIIRIATWLNG